jgi:hypothetical protein
MTDQDPNERPARRHCDIGYFALVGGLLVVIIATLAVLWMMERTKRLNAESRLDLAEYQLAGAEGKVAVMTQKMQGLVSVLRPALTSGPDEAAATPIDRSELAPARGVLNGQEVLVFDIRASEGRRMGFLPGDVIRVAVSRAATSRAATGTGVRP